MEQNNSNNNMDKNNSTAVSAARVAVLLALGMVAVGGMIADAVCDSAAGWLAVAAGLKLVAMAAAVAAFRLHRRWVKTDKWLAAWAAWDKRTYEREDNWL